MAAPIDSVPMARGAERPAWPLQGATPRTTFKSSASFGAPRTGGDKDRWHVGIDIAANRGDVVVAMEDGVLVCKGGTCEQGWMGPDAKAVLVQGDSGLVVLYGALIPGSSKEFGLGPGARVTRGQPLGRVGTYPAGSSMLHLETYAKGTTENAPWYQGKPAPPEILNPTEYLKLAAQVAEEEAGGGGPAAQAPASPTGTRTTLLAGGVALALTATALALRHLHRENRER